MTNFLVMVNENSKPSAWELLSPEAIVDRVYETTPVVHTPRTFFPVS